MSLPFNPKLKKAPNFPGKHPEKAIGKMFGGKQPKGAGKGAVHKTVGAAFSGDQHGLHGNGHKEPKHMPNVSSTSAMEKNTHKVRKHK